MKAVITNIYRVLRTIVVTGIVTVLSVYVLAYLFLVIPKVQNEIKGIAEKELSALLNTDVTIGKLTISPFNQVVLYDVTVPDQTKATLMHVDKLGAGMSLYNLAVNRKIVFTYAEIVGLDGHITKETPESKPNYQFIVDALSPKNKKTPPKKFDIKIYNIVIRKSAITYDVFSELHKTTKFDKNHISISNLRSDIALPKLKNDDFIIDIKRLSFNERSGFVLKDLTANATIKSKNIGVKQLRVELPNSLITPEDMEINFSSLKTLGKEIKNIPLELNIPNSYVTLSDFACFVPELGKFHIPFYITLATRGTLHDLYIPVLSLKTENELLSLDISGRVSNILKKDDLSFKIPHIQVKAKAEEITKITSNFAHLSAQADRIIKNCGNVYVDGSVKGNLRDVNFNGLIATSLGRVTIDGDFSNPKGKSAKGFRGLVKTDNFKLGNLLGKEPLLNEAAFDIKLVAQIINGKIQGKVDGNIAYIDFKGYRYNNIIANVDVKPSHYAGSVSIDDKNVKLDIEGTAALAGADSQFDVKLIANDINLANLNLYSKYPHHTASLKVDALFYGNNLENANGSLMLHDLAFVDENGKGIKLDNFYIIADNHHEPNQIEISSDVLNGNIVGKYDFKCLVNSFKDILSPIFPALISNTEKHRHYASQPINQFEYSLRVENNDRTADILSFFKSPIELLYPVTLSGHVDESNQTFSTVLDAPYLAQKNKLIEGSRLEAYINPESHNLVVNAQTTMPTKNGKMKLELACNGVNNRADTNLSWKIDRKEDFHGDLNFSVGLDRATDDNSLSALVDINPTQLVFNDTAWQVLPAKVNIDHGVINVDNVKAIYDKQFICINGTASKNSTDQLKVELKDINLDYIFQTLAISNVQFGGSATGVFYASDLFSKMPVLSTPNLHVVGFKYNQALLGDTDISSHWDNVGKFVAIDAVVSQPNGYKSKINGEIYPTMDSLRFDFNAQKINVQFMKPFMSAITSDIQGEASGHARLYGNFYNIDLYGDLFVENLKVKVDYTNVYYTTTDSIKIVPGLIKFKDVKLRDRNGHVANMTGWVRHKYFHDASFNFSVTDARDFLCYDITPKMNQRWYGTIYGNGSAFISGEPGLVNITVNMSTAENSKFTFVLSDSEAATEYNFITFNDRNKKEIVEEKLDEREQIVRRFTKKQDEINKSAATVVKINLLAEITPQAQMVLIMDPVGGDKIKATGSGNLKMVYNSADDKMEMYGNYMLQKGYYNFTLQDIIIKDFTIKEGSRITFDGDPMAAKIDIEAIYGLNANLQDLDESFATGKEMNRTNVPVHALLKVDGDIKQPAISFDLEFPTLTSDAYRKVKSIISTDDMMNRQIIYLLALNRFYTPEYMGNTNKSNELASVASSTISSQLSNILGQLSENWSISPNFRTDKGDFSDVEVNLALSSQLLNNRLLFNGNFGYRDNALNNRNSTFIGDFDIEYLLNKNGNIRLKAYNHYNDQNYYVKSALTTQGVGVTFRYDFDRPFDFLRKKKNSFKLDTVTVVEKDTLQLPIRINKP